jgi:hypothetical protein
MRILNTKINDTALGIMGVIFVICFALWAVQAASDHLKADVVQELQSRNLTNIHVERKFMSLSCVFSGKHPYIYSFAANKPDNTLVTGTACRTLIGLGDRIVYDD